MSNCVHGTIAGLQAENFGAICGRESMTRMAAL